MAATSFLNLSGLQIVANKINQKLTKVSTMPATPSDGDTVLYLGSSTNNYIHGCTYSYNENEAAWLLEDTSITLNGTNKTGDSMSLYAPVDAGTAGQVLTSSGNGNSPTWTAADTFLPSVENNTLIFEI